MSSIIYLVTPLGQFSFDATDSLQQNFTNEVTEYPVESGFDYTKGIISKADSYTLSGVISDYHLKDSRDFRSDEVVASLKRLKEMRALVTLMAKTRVITNLTIESISASESTSTGFAKDVQINLKEVRVASSATTTVPRSAKRVEVTGDDVADTSDPKKNAGTKPKEQVDDRKESAAYKMDGFFERFRVNAN